MLQNRRNDISLLRVMSMMFILLNHSITYLIPGMGGKLLHELFDIGIPLFLLISGFCYGKKEIRDWKDFYKRRFLRVVVPAYIMVAIVSMVEGIEGIFYDLYIYVMYCLNLQGFVFLCNLDIPLIEGLGPLWFVTVIMICYCLLPLLKKIHTIYDSEKIVIVCFAITTVVQALFGYRVFYIVLFILGYFYSKFDVKLSIKIISTALIFIMQIFRVFLNMYEESLPLYTYLAYACLSFALLGIWAFKAYFKIYENLELVRNVSESKLIAWLDKMSLFIYMVQLPIANKVFMLNNIPKSIGYTIWLLLTVLFAVMLNHVSKKIAYVMVTVSIQSAQKKKEDFR